jgi:hypothetical protein
MRHLSIYLVGFAGLSLSACTPKDIVDAVTGLASLPGSA